MRRKSSNSVPGWGWLVIVSFIAIIAGIWLQLNGTIPGLWNQLQEKPLRPAPPMPQVIQELPPTHSSIIPANAATIISGSTFLLNHSQLGVISRNKIPRYVQCERECLDIKTAIRTLPVNDPNLAEARSHLVEMAIGFEKMIQCFEESKDKDYLRLPEDNKFALATSANSVIEHFKRLELVCPE